MAPNYSAQYVLLLVSVLSGVGFGVICDVIRMFRMLVPHGRIAVFIEDLAFCVLCGAVNVICFFNYSYGRPRLYALLAAFGAGLVWRLTVGRLTRRILESILRFLKPRVQKAKKAVDFLMALVYTAFVYRRTLSKARRGFDLIERFKR